ncbi:hypothetical protein OpiT1DRAFT_04740 [Opitutaceae bacterium TAV1]|nr:hypothetical protein OpiT1DRAFT_04740 [Opitutaceae bacterium TAV1]
MSTEIINPTDAVAMIAADAPPVTAPPAPESARPADTVTPGVTPPAADAPKPGNLDAKNVPFDPARHTGKKHPKTGCWMPRSPGRGGSRQSTPSTSPSSATPTDAPPSPPASESPWSDEERAAAASPSPASPEAGKNGENGTENGTGNAPVTADANAGADLACRGLAAVVGRVTGAPEEAASATPEYKAMRDAARSYFSFRGWVAAGAIGLTVTVLAWLLSVSDKPKTSAWLAELLNRKKAPRPVAPSAAPQTVNIDPAKPTVSPLI